MNHIDRAVHDLLGPEPETAENRVLYWREAANRFHDACMPEDERRVRTAYKIIEQVIEDYVAQGCPKATEDSANRVPFKFVSDLRRVTNDLCRHVLGVHDRTGVTP